jgi:hypothetical protein
MTLYERVAGLEVEIDGFRLERRELEVSSGFNRVTTTIVLSGGGLEGRGEDVTYDAVDHDAVPEPELSGRTTFDELSRRIGATDLFPTPAQREASHDYRRWAFESAALDLGLRQAGLSLGEALGRPYRPVRFVVSTRLDIRPWLALDPTLEFKLDPTSEWDAVTTAAIAATGSVQVLDFKAYYTGTIVDQQPDPDLYRSMARLFPNAILEDAALTDETRAALDGALERLSWDAPIHSLADVDALAVPPRFLNVKPSRFGSVARLFDCIETCLARGMTLYGGGQFELGVGRGQIQALASLFYGDSANDVAPGEYNAPEPVPGLPRSPLEPPVRPVGFSWESES